MNYLTQGWIIIYVLSALWLCGWIASVHDTSVSQETRLLKKIGGIILLFFIWPYIALCMASQGDV
jgi:hypothetical protein